MLENEIQELKTELKELKSLFIRENMDTKTIDDTLKLANLYSERLKLNSKDVDSTLAVIQHALWEENKALINKLADEGIEKIPCDTHELKILPEWFNDVQSGKKNFEVRRADRNFKVGDYLLLKEWYRGKFTGRQLTRQIEYVYRGDGTYGLSEDYCILGIKDNGMFVS